MKEHPKLNTCEDSAVENAYWMFDAMKNGLGKWKGAPYSERDAFKKACRSLLSTLQRMGINASVRGK